MEERRGGGRDGWMGEGGREGWLDGRRDGRKDAWG